MPHNNMGERVTEGSDEYGNDVNCLLWPSESLDLNPAETFLSWAHSSLESSKEEMCFGRMVLRPFSRESLKLSWLKMVLRSLPMVLI